MTIFDEAIRLAISAHSGQTRKTDKTPYILHPMEVACIASSVSDDLDLLTAAVLHDAVEDTAVSVDEIAAKFGDRVAQIVATETEDKQGGFSPASEKLRRPTGKDPLAGRQAGQPPFSAPRPGQRRRGRLGLFPSIRS